MSACTILAEFIAAPSAARISTERRRPCASAMLDRLRQGERLCNDQRGTPPLAGAHRLSRGSYQHALIALPARTPPQSGRCRGHGSLESGPRSKGGCGAGDHRRLSPGPCHRADPAGEAGCCCRAIPCLSSHLALRAAGMPAREVMTAILSHPQVGGQSEDRQTERRENGLQRDTIESQFPKRSRPLSPTTSNPIMKIPARADRSTPISRPVNAGCCGKEKTSTYENPQRQAGRCSQGTSERWVIYSQIIRSTDENNDKLFYIDPAVLRKINPTISFFIQIKTTP